MNFCVAISILKVEENMQHFLDIMIYYFKKGKNTTEMQKMICAVYGEGAVTSNVPKVVCKVLCWRFLTGQCSTVDQLKLIAMK